MAISLSGNRLGRAAQTEAREFRQYVQDMNAVNRKAVVIAVCQEIRDMMTQEQYDAWWEAALDAYFLEHAKVKLAAMQAEHAIELASSIDVDTTAEEREIAGDIATFGRQGILEMVEHTPRSRMLIESGAVDENGNLKPYRIKDGHRGTPMTIEEMGDDGQDFIY